MFGLEPWEISMIRQLHGRGEAVDNIAGGMRMETDIVQAIVDKLGPQTEEEGRAEGEAWEAAEAKRAARPQADKAPTVNTTKRGR